MYQYVSSNTEENQFSNTCTWCKQLNKLLLSSENLWKDQKSANKRYYNTLISIRLKECFREKWVNSTKKSHKGLDYLELSMFNNELKPYSQLHNKR